MVSYWNQPTSAGRDPKIGMVNKFEETRKIYCNDDGEVKKVGDIIINRDMANLYQNIALNGIDHFYNGEVSEKIILDMKENGGLMAKEDFRE